MTSDATFDDGREAPLNLGALDRDDLQVLSALAQDSVFLTNDMTWRRKERQFVVLLNRFRWEDRAADRYGPERVRALLVVDHVLGVSSQGIDRSESDLVLSVLTLSFSPGEDGAGDVLLTLAGDGVIRLSVEALEVTLRDVTRPYSAPSGAVPTHE